jgi:Strictosidine synthase
MSGALESLRSLLVPHRRQHAIPTLDGAHVPNDRLEELPSIGPDLPAPDDIAAGENGAVYVSSANRLVRLSGEGLREQAVVATFETPITAFIRLHDGRFALALNGGGVRVVGADGRTVAQADQVNGKALRCVTAIAEDPAGGGLYLAVGSTLHDADDWVVDLMERNSRGLLAYWRAGGAAVEVLLSGLSYPNGLQVEGNGESLLFTQSWTHSLVRYRRGGNGTGGTEVLIDNMPGYPARIAPASAGGHWLAIFAMRTQLIELVLRETEFRTEMMRSVDPELWIRPALRATGSYLEPLQGGGIKKLGIRKPWAPPRAYGLVVRLDAHCEPMFSLHSRVDGRNHGVMAAREIGDRLFVVAKGNDRLLVEDRTSAGAPR